MKIKKYFNWLIVQRTFFNLRNFVYIYILYSGLSLKTFFKVYTILIHFPYRVIK